MPGVRCPHHDCGTLLSDVVDSRAKGGTVVRRRRCINGHTFITQEVVMLSDSGVSKGPPLSAQIRAMLRAGTPELEVAGTLNVSSHYVRKLARELGATK